MKSWIFGGKWHYDAWIRNDDGVEWHAGGLLELAMAQGQRIAFAWYATEGGRSRGLAAVKNCATGESKVRSDNIGLYFDTHAYGRQAAIAALILAAVIWFGGFMSMLPSVVLVNPIAALVAVVASAAFVGFLFSCLANPDPDREIDRAIEVGLEAMYQACRHLDSDSTGNPRRSRRHKRGSGVRRIQHASS